jgi:hypothetical protein
MKATLETAAAVPNAVEKTLMKCTLETSLAIPNAA